MIVQKIKRNFMQMLDVFEETLVFERYKNLSDRKASNVSGFAVNCHPYNYTHLAKYLQSFNPELKLPSREFLSKIFEHDLYVFLPNRITGVQGCDARMFNAYSNVWPIILIFMHPAFC